MQSNISLAETETDESVPVLALRPKPAAAALSISERLLWTKTQSGEIPHCRVGKCLLYPVDELRRWLSQQSRAAQSAEQSEAEK